eukprot:3515533-Pyramimonas_sp.AAC.1
MSSSLPPSIMDCRHSDCRAVRADPVDPGPPPSPLKGTKSASDPPRALIRALITWWCIRR